MDVIIWIKCMGKWMTCCHKRFTISKNDWKESSIKKEKKGKSYLICEQYANAWK
jgi:hypothetical protein